MKLLAHDKANAVALQLYVTFSGATSESSDIPL